MENTTDFIRSPTLKGTQAVAGIWFPTHWFDNERRRRLVIKYYFLGCEIYQFEQGDLLKFPTEKTLHCEQLEGWPLIYQNGLLCSTKLSKIDNRQFYQADLLLITGNHISTYYFSDAVNIDPSLWVDLNDYPLLETKSYSLNSIYQALPELIIESKSMAQIFDGKIPSPSPKLMAFIEQEKQNAEQSPSKQNVTSKPLCKWSESKLWLLCIVIFLVLFLFFYIAKQSRNLLFELEDSTYVLKVVFLFIVFLFSVFINIKLVIELFKLIKDRKQGINSNKIVVKPSLYCAKKLDDGLQNNKDRYVQTSNHTYSTYCVDNIEPSQFISFNGQLDDQVSSKNSIANTTSIANHTNSIPERRHNHNRKPSRWRNYLSLFSMVLKLDRLIAFRQSHYLETMIKKFEKGNLEDALRYAIPLGANNGSTAQSFGTPKPRNKLSLSESVYSNSFNIYLDKKFHQYLQSLYLQSFEKLAKENKTEQAVYVLVELLNNLQEGLAFLEERKLYKQAMELAIARDADPEQIVKLCCLANDWDKAIMIARRDNIFANAILILEKTNQQVANKLRLEWANTLAEKAEWLAAIDAIWPLTQYRHLAEQWFNYVDPLNPKAIVKRFILKPGDALDKLEDSLAIIKNTPNYYQKRLDIAQEIIAQQKYAESLKSLLGVLINAIVLDVVTYPNTLTTVDIARLIAFTQDQSTRVDIPISSLASLKLVKPCSLVESTITQYYRCPEVGHRAIYSMVALTDDRYLLALGQAGIIIVDHTSKQRAHFMIAADKLVISDNKMQVLALAECGDYYRIHKVDLSTKKTVDLGIIKFQRCHDEFDGINWTIINNNCIEVIDISTKLSVVWRVDLSPNQIEQIARNQNNEMYLTLTPNDEIEEFHYSRSNHYLTYRDNVDIEQGLSKIASSKNQGVLLFKYDKTSQRIQFKPRNYRYHQYNEIPLNVSQEQFDTMGILSVDYLTILVIKRLNDPACDIYFYHYLSNSFKMIIDWHSSDQLSIFCGINECCLFDKHGRGLHINVNENKVTSLSI